ncbi:unnamed protein product [Owenia fusiformis]|uniref:Uncharacterized protein n=1 Tax=Owenia fusiformis TaxID=6347 RepID=A0A8J1T516_OWEFU|nr:unnamed protein product [Owenia fusiformis]
MISTDTTTKLAHNAMPIRYQLTRRPEANQNTVIQNKKVGDSQTNLERSTVDTWRIEKDLEGITSTISTSGADSSSRNKHVTFADAGFDQSSDSVDNNKTALATTFPFRQSSYVQHLKSKSFVNDSRSGMHRVPTTHSRPSNNKSAPRKASGSIPRDKYTDNFALDPMIDVTDSEMATPCDLEGQTDKDDIVLSYRKLTRSLNDLQKPLMIPGILPVIPPRKSSGKSNISNPEAEYLRSRSPHIGIPALKYSNRPNSVVSVVSSDDLDRAVNDVMLGKTRLTTPSVSSNFREHRSRSQPTPEPNFIEVDDNEITVYQMKIMTHLANQYRYRYVPRIPKEKRSPSSAPVLKPPRQLPKQYLSEKDAPKDGNTCTFSPTDVHKIILERIKTLHKPRVIQKDTPKKHKGKLILGSPKKYVISERHKQSELRQVTRSSSASNEYFKINSPLKQPRYMYTL